jgi:hypothetical protein
MYVIYLGVKEKSGEYTMQQLVLPLECFGVFDVGRTGNLERLCGLVVKEFLATDPEARVRLPELSDHATPFYP